MDGRALNGLGESLKAQGKVKAIAEIEASLTDACQWADAQLTGSQVDESNVPSFVLQLPNPSSIPPEALAIRNVYRE